MIDSLPNTISAIETSAGRSAPAIEARDLVKTYGGKVRALDGLSFTVEAGAVFALLGPNGAGKSTTIKILNTLSRPDSGSALVAGIGVAVGAAWGGLLANLAAGAFLIVLRPFKVGDYVKAGGVEGTVSEVGLFATHITTPDRTEEPGP